MTFPLTQTTNLIRKQTNLKPEIVFTIDGVSTKFGAVVIFEYVRVGDPGLYINNYLGDPWTIGGLRTLLDQADYISFESGTSTRITQQLQPDKGLGTSVTTMKISLIDKNEDVSEIISPGFVVAEILGKKCTVELGFQDTAYPQDYITIFRGILENIDSGPGNVGFSLSSTEQKKRQTVFTRATAKTTGDIDLSSPVSSITVDDASQFLQKTLGPDGTYDSSIEFYVRIGNEFFSYTGISGNTFTGVTRGALGYGTEEHSTGSDVSSVIRLTGNGLDLARKIMLSGSGNYLSALPISNFNQIAPATIVQDTLFFFEKDLGTLYGVFPGDYVTTTGASNGANNVTAKQIIEVVKTNDGTYLRIDGVSFVTEIGTAATVSIRSKWDTLPDGCAMVPDDVDLEEFNFIYRTFLSSFDFDFRLQDSKEAKTFIEEQILRPMSAFSIQRKGRVSLGYHIGPIPGAEILTLDQGNIENADKLRIQRSVSKNFYNTVIYQIDQNDLTQEFATVTTAENTASVNDFNVGSRSMTIKSEGMRQSTQGPLKALQAANRYLNRYARGAEFIDNAEVRFGDGFSAEIGDTVLLDTNSLHVTDIKSGSRQGTTRLFQILNKTTDVKNGKVIVNLTDTNFSTAARYCLIAPASKVRSAVSDTVFTLMSSYSSVYGTSEFLKWERFGQIIVRVKSPDGTTRNATARIDSFSGNTVTLQSGLGFTPQSGDIMEFSTYNDQSSQVKAVYGSMRNTDPFDDGSKRYQML